MKPTRTATRAPDEGGAGEIPGTARALAAQQAEDEGLWFVARTAPEAYLQAALRALHAAVEAERSDALSELWRDAVACEARDCGCIARIAARVEKELEAT